MCRGKENQLVTRTHNRKLLGKIQQKSAVNASHPADRIQLHRLIHQPPSIAIHLQHDFRDLKIRIAGLHANRKVSVDRQFELALNWSDDFDLGSQIGQNLDRKNVRIPIAMPFFADKFQSIVGGKGTVAP